MNWIKKQVRIEFLKYHKEKILNHFNGQKTNS